MINVQLYVVPIIDFNIHDLRNIGKQFIIIF